MNCSRVLQLAIVFCLLSAAVAQAKSMRAGFSATPCWSLEERINFLEQPPTPASACPADPRLAKSVVAATAQVMLPQWHNTSALADSLANTATQRWQHTATKVRAIHAAVANLASHHCTGAVDRFGRTAPVAIVRAALTKTVRVNTTPAESGQTSAQASNKDSTMASRPLLPAISPTAQYWGYYADCDRWQVDLTLAIAPKTPPISGAQAVLASGISAKPPLAALETATGNLTRLLELTKRAGAWLTDARQQVAQRWAFKPQPAF